MIALPTRGYLVTNLDPMNRGLKHGSLGSTIPGAQVTNLDPMNRGLKRVVAGGHVEGYVKLQT